VRLQDPASGQDAALDNNGSASPTIGLDDDVYYGVLESSFENHGRGWLLHFDAELLQSKTPGAFGWDATPSIVPRAMVPSYSGTSSYLLMTKYNDYVEQGGDGLNRLAILDPSAAETDPVTGIPVMKEVLSIAGPTPDGPPPIVKEWCINSAAVDSAAKAVFAGSEDGKLYRWDLTANQLTQAIVLTAGVGQAYTPTVIGVDGTVYAIANATLFAVGNAGNAGDGERGGNAGTDGTFPENFPPLGPLAQLWLAWPASSQLERRTMSRNEATTGAGSSKPTPIASFTSSCSS
jgi:hypothetical protein